jgi:trk system potassium uptake protein TrkA
VPEGDEPLEGGDELLFVATAEVEEELQKLLLPDAQPAPD